MCKLLCCVLCVCIFLCFFRGFSMIFVSGVMFSLRVLYVVFLCVGVCVACLNCDSLSGVFLFVFSVCLCTGFCYMLCLGCVCVVFFVCVLVCVL